MFIGVIAYQNIAVSFLHANYILILLCVPVFRRTTCVIIDSIKLYITILSHQVVSVRLRSDYSCRIIHDNM
jgi:hypothetical protein